MLGVGGRRYEASPCYDRKYTDTAWMRGLEVYCASVTAHDMCDDLCCAAVREGVKTQAFRVLAFNPTAMGIL